jgi:hypothetical protein
MLEVGWIGERESFLIGRWAYDQGVGIGVCEDSWELVA